MPLLIIVVTAGWRSKTGYVHGLVDLKSLLSISHLEASIHHVSNAEGEYFSGSLEIEAKASSSLVCLQYLKKPRFL